MAVDGSSNKIRSNQNQIPREVCGGRDRRAAHRRRTAREADRRAAAAGIGRSLFWPRARAANKSQFSPRNLASKWTGSIKYGLNSKWINNFPSTAL